MSDAEKTLILSRVLKSIGFDQVDMDNFDNRLKYQKLIYLTQNFGLSLGYGYSWYVKGPYSPELTKTLFTITPESLADSDNFRFQNDDVVIGKIREIKTILDNKIQDPFFLEILASIVYIKKYLQSEISPENLRVELLKRKPKMQDNIDFERTFSEAFRLMPKFVT
jgi:uncharacterized protein YwgA